MIFLCLFSGSTDQPHQQLYLECIHYQVKIKLKNIKVFIYPYNSWMLQHAKLTFDKTLNTKIYQTPPPELSCNVSQQHMLLSNLTKIRNWHKLISRREFVNHKLSQIKLFWTCRVFFNILVENTWVQNWCFVFPNQMLCNLVHTLP